MSQKARINNSYPKIEFAWGGFVKDTIYIIEILMEDTFNNASMCTTNGLFYNVRVTAQEMRGGPLGAGLQEQASNHPKLRW